MITKSIDEMQDEIVQEFAILNGDLERVLFHIANFGFSLPEMPAIYRTDDNLIRGCQSKVWLGAASCSGLLHFYADSDTIISKGLVSLLLKVFNGHRAAEILNAELYFIRQSDLERFIGTKRSNGFYAMIEQLRTCCLNR